MKTKLSVFLIFFFVVCETAGFAGPISDFFRERRQKRLESVAELGKNEAGVTAYSLWHQGILRTYYVHIPPSYDGKIAVPLVLNFHGGGANAESARKQTKFDEKADQDGFIVVYPQGTGKKVFGTYHGSWNGGRMGGGDAYKKNIDDVGFVREILNHIELRYRVDKNRIFATGISMGGMLSYRLACELGGRIAAIAPVAGALAVDRCEPLKPVSVLHFHGTADRLVPYQGGPSDSTLSKVMVVGGPYLPVSATIKLQAEKNQCPAASNVSYQNGNVTCETKSQCSQNTEVTLCTIQGGGHTWPGGKVVLNNKAWNQIVGETTQDIFATDVIWDFFKRHPKNA